MISLKGRLLQIASMAAGYHRPADIGTDHAYIPIYLVQSGLCDSVIGTDIHNGPICKAAANVDKYNLSDKIELRQGDGIRPIQAGECDAFILAGMGGYLITEILEASVETVKKAKALIIQPLYTPEVLREYLLTNGFSISAEKLVRDDGRIYVVIKAAYTGVIRQDEPLYYRIGRKLFEEQDPLLQEYFKRQIRIQSEIVEGLSKSEVAEKRSLYPQEERLLADMRQAYHHTFS